jgi:hypothetical protein
VRVGDADWNQTTWRLTLLTGSYEQFGVSPDSSKNADAKKSDDAAAVSVSAASLPLHHPAVSAAAASSGQCPFSSPLPSVAVPPSTQTTTDESASSSSQLRRRHVAASSSMTPPAGRAGDAGFVSGNDDTNTTNAGSSNGGAFDSRLPIDADDFQRLFPFHFIIDRECRIVGAGSRIMKVLAEGRFNEDGNVSSSENANANESGNGNDAVEKGTTPTAALPRKKSVTFGGSGADKSDTSADSSSSNTTTFAPASASAVRFALGQPADLFFRISAPHMDAWRFDRLVANMRSPFEFVAKTVHSAAAAAELIQPAAAAAADVVKTEAVVDLRNIQSRPSATAQSSSSSQQQQQRGGADANANQTAIELSTMKTADSVALKIATEGDGKSSNTVTKNTTEMAVVAASSGEVDSSDPSRNRLGSVVSPTGSAGGPLLSPTAPLPPPTAPLKLKGSLRLIDNGEKLLFMGSPNLHTIQGMGFRRRVCSDIFLHPSGLNSRRDAQKSCPI